MHIHLYLAPSLNGIISHSDGNEDFISEHSWQVQAMLIKEAGVFIVSRKSLEVVESWKDAIYSFDAIEADKIVVTHDEDYKREGWEVAHSTQEVIEILQREGHTKAHLCGGATLAGDFLNKGLVQEVYFLLQPYLVSEGVSLVSNLAKDTRLKITKTEVFDSGEMLIQATVE